MMATRSDPNSFAALESRLSQFDARGRTPSAAFLLWFLQTVYRLDDVDAQDATCDSRLDGGIDAISVDEQERRIVLFQAKRREKLPATLGDTDLKEFVGSIAQFASSETARTLEQRTENTDLKRLLVSLELAKKIDDGYQLRGIFMANVAANANAIEYVQAAMQAGTPIDLWDLQRLAPILAQLERDWYVDHPISLKISKGKVFFDGPRIAPRLVYAAIPAKELVRLPGISDTRLFAQNVRLGLGKTRVNKEIIDAVRDPADHASFLAFHNGLTLVAKYLRLKNGSIRMNNYCVCNGCQSLLAFYNNRGALTDAMEVLVRIVKVTKDRALADDIAYRTNNQNPISLRDLHSNDETQVQLRAEFDASYGRFATYSIKRGEATVASELSNEYAGRLLLALYAREPWSAHQKYRIFGDLQDKIFRYGVSAHHIRLAQLISEQVQAAGASLSAERVREYSLTAFVLLYLVGEMLRESPQGIHLLNDPAPCLSSSEGDNPMQPAILRGVLDLALAAVAEVNYYVQDHGADAYDYKSEFKSPTRVQQIRTEVLKAYQKDVFRGRASLFALPTTT
jgi:hypothetical protein